MRPRFDLFGELRPDEDPYPVYARLREGSPVWRGGPGQWLVTRYDEVAAALRDPRLAQFHFGAAYRMFPEANLTGSLGDGPASRFVEHSVVTRDRPAHGALRRHLNRAVGPRVLAGLRDAVPGLADRLITAACGTAGRSGGSSFDAVPDLAFPLPLLTLGELAGATPPPEVGRRLLTLTRIFAPVVPDADRRAADEAVVWLRRYVADLPGGPVRALLDEPPGLTREELLDNVVFLFFAGFETSLNLIAGGCALLARHPAEQARLRADPALIPSAVEEFLRYDTPTQVTGRIVVEPLEIAGQPVRPGRVVLLLLASANRDPRRFPEPDRLDVGRAPNPHVAFGGGAHYCLGAALARLEAAAAFAALLRRFRALEPDGPVARHPGATLRPYAGVPLKAAA
ncbi:cytochrome P450 [Bailinhaonella thermotolerans]|uniref:Cytochrome P450 n=1 Tax=Bailinhaonella thermotolerans TaxID=1070861 RepID=A0A3A4ANM7_9ACTN|nr:cytochrome P450 [Bailinhaonella thermotolerans]RJL27220.1 cytochrome P450 [Bailinhaonella thermotolerans]